MLQALLADCFKLTVHRETRQLPVFGLVLARPGRPGAQLVLPPTRPPANSVRWPHRRRTGRTNRHRGSGARAPRRAMRAHHRRNRGGRSQPGMGRRTAREPCDGGGFPWRATPLERPVVVDRTGLDGLFDVTMVWNPQIQELRRMRQTRRVCRFSRHCASISG